MIDERDGSRVARKRGLRVTGTLGLLDLAAERGLVNFAQAIQSLEGTTFRRPTALLEALLLKHRMLENRDELPQVIPSHQSSSVIRPHLAQSVPVPTLEGMEVHFSPEQEAQLSRVASHAGMDTELFVKQAALRHIEERNRFSAAVREGIAQADRGELIDDDDVRLWLEQQERS